MAKTTKEDAPVIWEPHKGTSQELYLTCPEWELLGTGTRGGGKTDVLLMDFAQHVGQGWGADWRGVLFRNAYKPLSEVIKKSEKWFHQIFPGARFLHAPNDYRWVFADGEELLFRAMDTPSDYWHFHGHEYPWIGWEELTAWPNLECYHVMKSCNRSSRTGIPIKYRSTCNPYGPGHNVVKAYFIDPAPKGVPFVAERGSAKALAAEYGVKLPETENPRRTVTIHSHYSENKALMEAQPDYPAFIAAAAANPEQAKAWLHDDWDIVAGGMFDDVWNAHRHILPKFEVPKGWRIDRTYDWGSTKPFSVGWWAEANGESAITPMGTFTPPPKSLIRIAEWYGWDGRTPNVGVRMTDSDVGKGIIKMEREMGLAGRVKAGPADSSIFDAHPGQTSPAEEMSRHGAQFIPADKSSGSRKRGWEIMRRMMAEAQKARPEGPGLWVMEDCRQFIRTVPAMPRSDKDPDDCDSSAEDHCIIGSTMVETLNGAVAIEQLVGQEGWLWSLGGPQWFTNCRMTQRGAHTVAVTFANGVVVKCTPDHRILTESDGWIEAVNLTDEICYSVPIQQEGTWKQLSRLSQVLFRSSKGRGITSAGTISNVEANDCIVKYGRPCTDQSQPPMLFTTLITTAQTIRRATSRSWRKDRTLDTTGLPAIPQRKSSHQPMKRQERGMVVPLGLSGIANNTKGFAESRYLAANLVSASTAAMSSMVYGNHDTAGTTASQQLAERQVLTPWTANARAADKRSKSIVITKPKLAAPWRVISVTPSDDADVFCLDVPNTSAFAIENGLIIHNCADESRYRCLATRQIASVRTVHI